MTSLSTVSTETDIAGLERPDDVISSSQFEIPIGSLTLYHSEGCHIGPKIVAESVTYINEESNKTRKRRLTNNIMIIIIAPLLFAILILIVIKNKSDIDNSGKKKLPDSKTTHYPTIDTTTNTPWEPINITTTLPPTIIPPMPEDWIIPYYNWSLVKNIPCIKNTPSYTVSIETIKSPKCQDSEDYLITYENTNTLKHNFYISGDGHVFEGYGWYCSSEYNYRYSRSVIKVAFFCTAEFSHILTFKKLVDYGLNNKLLHKDYNVLPECCRNPYLSSIDNETMIFLRYSKGTTFKNPSCIGYNPQCNILT